MIQSLKRKEVIKPPPTKNRQGPLHHSDPIKFKTRKWGWLNGSFYKESGGFYRDENGHDYDPISILEWKFISS